jgi:hypothetical protein
LPEASLSHSQASLLAIYLTGYSLHRLWQSHQSRRPPKRSATCEHYLPSLYRKPTTGRTRVECNRDSKVQPFLAGAERPPSNTSMAQKDSGEKQQNLWTYWCVLSVSSSHVVWHPWLKVTTPYL